LNCPYVVDKGLVLRMQRSPIRELPNVLCSLAEQSRVVDSRLKMPRDYM